MSKTKTTITLGEIECIAMVFRTSGDNLLAVVPESMTRDDFEKRFNSDYTKPRVQRANGFTNLDSSWGRHPTTFWAVCHADCYDPPIVIVRADGIEDAIDIAVDEIEWLQADPEDYIDGDSIKGKGADAAAGEPGDYAEELGWTGNGTAYDSETIQAWEVKLVRVECE